MNDETEALAQSCSEVNASFQYEEIQEELDQSLDLPTFEFSSPISSIGSSCSSPDCDRTSHLNHLREQSEINYSSDYVSLEELKSQISPPSDDDSNGFGSTKKTVEILETIFEDCYLETPPGTPTAPKPKKPRRVRMNLSNCDEFKENVQNNNTQPEPQPTPHPEHS